MAQSLCPDLFMTEIILTAIGHPLYIAEYKQGNMMLS